MVTTTQTKNKPTNYYKSPKTATCTSMGNQVTCRDTSIDLSPMVDAYGGYGKTTTSTYDANASGRNGYVQLCVQDALKEDDNFRKAVRQEKINYNYQQTKISQSKDPLSLELSHSSNENGKLVCYYGEQHRKYVADFVCPESMRFKE